MITVELSVDAGDLERIVALQRSNLSNALPAELRGSEGFVTMEYTVAELERIKGGYRHVVAKSGDELVGYALILLREHRTSFPFLDEMFGAAEAFAGERPYFIMGQVCVDQAFRGQGIFRRLYGALRAQMRADFELVITEVSVRNGRSMHAHQAIGFKDTKAASGEATEWRVLAWDWSR